MTPASPASIGHEEPRRVVQFALGLGTVLLATGARTVDVEEDVRSVTAALGAPDAQVVVTFSSIAICVTPGEQLEPLTVLRLVTQRAPDHARLAAAYSLVHSVTEGRVALQEATERLASLSALKSPYPRILTFFSAGLSAAAVTILYGGSALDALATLAIGLLVQPVVDRMAPRAIPVFFQLAVAAALGSLLAVVLAGVGAPITGGLVVTGSLLRFLPGAELVAGIRDLLEGAIVSGTARLAEAVLLGAGVAVGASLSLAAGERFDVHLSLASSGGAAWMIAGRTAAAALACGLYALKLGIPRSALLAAAGVGGLGWLVYWALLPGTQAALATGLAAGVVGLVGGYLARRASAPTAVWVVPASLPLLPGLLLVQGLIAVGQSSESSSLVAAGIVAFALGVGAAGGDMVALAAYRFNRRVVQPMVRPAAQALNSGVDVISGLRSTRGPAHADRDEDRDAHRR